MLDLQRTLNRHDTARIGDGSSCARFYKDIVGTNPAHRIDIVTANADSSQWDFRIYDDSRKICHYHHFRSATDALAAALSIRTEEKATEPRLRRIERWQGDDAYAVDGLVSSDVIIAAIKPNEWLFHATDNNHVGSQRNGPWSSAEEAFLENRLHFHKANRTGQ
jgi:hypothetical protein